MRCFRFVGFWVALASLYFFTAEARAGQYSGLWVGTATLNAVSEVNQRGSDLSFDLGLEGMKAENSLIATEFIGVESEGWRYLHYDEGPGPDAKWYDTGYDDTAWSIGQARFGYGEKPELIKTELISASSTKPPAAYFRKKFSVTGSDNTHLRVMLLQDDGAVVYVNGIEVLRANMPFGPISHTTAPVMAMGSVDENRYLVREIKLSKIPGLVLNHGANANVIAVEVHQHARELGGAPADITAMTRTPAAFDLRFLLHVDSNDQVRLLKEVIQMYDSKNEQHVLLTDHELIPNYIGIAVRDGEPVGRRLSAPGFDFEGTSVDCSGAVSLSSTVTCKVTLPSDHQTNPFLHRYHPDHDNLDARYEPIAEEENYEAYNIERDITVAFIDHYPPDKDESVRTPPPDWGASLLGGYYEETVSGLHKDPISVRGPFLLQRVASTAKLNE